MITGRKCKGVGNMGEKMGRKDEREVKKEEGEGNR